MSFELSALSLELFHLCLSRNVMNHRFGADQFPEKRNSLTALPGNQKRREEKR